MDIETLEMKDLSSTGSAEDSAQKQREEIEKKLLKNEQEMHKLQNEWLDLNKALKKSKLDSLILSSKARGFAETAGPMDNEFFVKLGEDKEAIGEIISTVLGVPVRVETSIPEYSITLVGSRGVRLDNYSVVYAEAELLEESDWGKPGTMVDIEIQKADNDDHEYRVFYNGASMVINKTPRGTRFEDLPRAIVIYISSFDVFGDKNMFYETIKVDSKSKKLRRSPVSEYYVNLQYLDDFAEDPDEKIRRISALMKVFRDIDQYDERFPAFSNRKRMLHETEEGVTEVSKEFQLELDAERKEGYEDGRKEMGNAVMFLYNNGRGEEISRVFSDGDYYRSILNEIKGIQVMSDSTDA